ncbi:hypothetical protein [Falsiroseomonas sp. E2-1-a4]|uniref:hypothetical protein n=1 Tax=Falsiroseomonas sp. E2-1-a4 TaxID=3239299 RepID=UPI003F336DEF
MRPMLSIRIDGILAARIGLTRRMDFHPLGNKGGIRCGQCRKRKFRCGEVEVGTRRPIIASFCISTGNSGNAGNIGGFLRL